MPDFDPPEPLTRAAASALAGPLGWRFVLNLLQLSVPVTSLAQAAEVAAAVVAAAGDGADGHLRLDLRPDRVELSLLTRLADAVTMSDTAMAARISSALDAGGLVPAGSSVRAVPRPVQAFEICLDTMDAQLIRPFWQAVLAAGDPPRDGDDSLVDPAGQLPNIWFQQMDEPRTERNRIHFDISVADDEGADRVRAALAAGGRLLSEADAPSFWVLADPEGNEVCVCTWVGRDEWRDE